MLLFFINIVFDCIIQFGRKSQVVSQVDFVSEMYKSKDPSQLLIKVLQPFCGSQNPLKMLVSMRDAHTLSLWIQSQWRQENFISLK